MKKLLSLSLVLTLALGVAAGCKKKEEAPVAAPAVEAPKAPEAQKPMSSVKAPEAAAPAAAPEKK